MIEQRGGNMKCKYCGVEIGNSLECHLCGHKQIGKTKCPVCSKLIYPYQEYCSNCGSPTIYRKDNTIKKVTPDTSVHSEQSHNYNTVTESYDYKKNAYDFKDSLNTLKSSFDYKKAFKKPNINHSQKKANKSFVKTVLGIIFGVCFIFIPVSQLIINTVSNIVDTTNEVESSFNSHGNTDLTSFNLKQDSSRGDYNQNFTTNYGGAFVYQNKLYASLNNQFVRYDENFENKTVLEENSCDHIYVDDRGCFYEDYNDFIILDTHDIKKTILTDVSYCYVLDQKIFYIKDNILYVSTIDENMNVIDTQKVKDQVSNYVVDEKNQRILYTNTDYERKFIDFNGTSLKDKVNGYGDGYFIDGFYYYREYDGIYKTDFNDEELVQGIEDIYYFAVGQDEENEQQIVYSENYDNVLEAYVDQDTSYSLYDNARDFYIIGDKVIFMTYDKDYNSHYFISSYDGDYAPLQE